jgi:hypothetical protein
MPLRGACNAPLGGNRPEIAKMMIIKIGHLITILYITIIFNY